MSTNQVKSNDGIPSKSVGSCDLTRSGMTRAEKKTREHGVAALEMAILLPFLLALLGGIIDFGYIFWVDLTLTNAVREGARVGATKTVTEDPVVHAQSNAESYLEVLGGRFTGDIITPTFDQDSSSITVTGRIDFTEDKALIGLLPAAIFPITLYSEAVMRWELGP